ncbi:MAG: hypothetical protein K2Y29_12700 [Beijerinckiaceae bacterium]|nr:hypothetical protein [Beijerinckiaceae bacterium]
MKIESAGAARLTRAWARVKTKRAALIFASALVPISTSLVVAQGLPASPPMPPPRPTMPGDPPRAMEPSTPSLSPAQRREEAPLPPTSAPAGNGADAPQISPNVDRTALRACAIEWHRMKASGAAGALIWRDFAPGCLAKLAKPRE